MCCTLKSFCGMGLSTAGLVIGWISFAFSLIETIIYIVVISSMVRIIDVTYSSSYGHDGPMIGTAISIVTSIHLGFALLDLAASILLILGIYKRMHLMILPWLLHNGNLLVVRYLVILIWYILGAISSLWIIGPPFPAWLGFSFILGIWAWLWFVVLSLYKTIRAERDASGVDYELFAKDVNTAESENDHGTLISVNHLLLQNQN